MAEQTAFNARDTAAAALKEEVRQLKKYRDKGNPNLRLLESKNKKVNDAKEDLMNRHYHYGLKAGKELSSTEMTDYLNEKVDEANDEMDEVMLLIDNLQSTEKDLARDHQKVAEENAAKERKTYELKIAKLQYPSDEKNVRERVKALTEELEKEEVEDEDVVSEEKANLVESLLSEVELAMVDQIKSWNDVKTLGDDADLDAIFKSEEEIKKLVADARSKAQSRITKLRPKEPSQPVTTIQSKSSDSNMMKFEKAHLPRFGGNTRSYARFKKNFEDIVVPNVTNEIQRLFTLKDTPVCMEKRKNWLKT